MNDFYGLLSGMGIGAVIASLITIFFEKRKFLLQMKIQKYSDLIDAYREHVAHPEEGVRRQKYVAAQEQVALIGSKEVIELSKKFYSAEPKESPQIQSEVVQKMRADLKRGWFRFF